jgi:hypothetical protein
MAKQGVKRHHHVPHPSLEFHRFTVPIGVETVRRFTAAALAIAKLAAV